MYSLRYTVVYATDILCHHNPRFYLYFRPFSPFFFYVPPRSILPRLLYSKGCGFTSPAYAPSSWPFGGKDLSAASSCSIHTLNSGLLHSIGRGPCLTLRRRWGSCKCELQASFWNWVGLAGEFKPYRLRSMRIPWPTSLLNSCQSLGDESYLSTYQR